ncbi:MAG: hypothetical protein UY65_C0014G0021 [Parcubacteria group bacterium GW2011_GWA2_51_12]|nr:MAG: hypothetical protein UY65_C0014G0021 [Parcubacteria group bacterium GW2011_GWA2_51_12]
MIHYLKKYWPAGLILLLFVIVIMFYTLSSQSYTKYDPSQLNRLTTSTISVSECRNESVSGFTVYGLGTHSLAVKGYTDSECVLEYTDELEGGYTVYDCWIPRGAGDVNIGNLDVKKYCKQERQGSIFQDLAQ